jgi:DNA-binding response OmpR family regulator
MLTAAATVNDRVAGFDLGADDYLPKPFAYVELLARVKALARRGSASSGTVLEAGQVRLDTVRRTVERDGTPLLLTPKEYGVLEALLAAKSAWVSVDDLFDEVWYSRDYGDDEGASKAVVKVAVYTLRRKLGQPDPIESATGFGYRIVSQP